MKAETNSIIQEKIIRFIFMVIYACINYILQFVIWGISAIQFIISIFSKKPNKNLLNFSIELSEFSLQIMKYLLQGTETRPYPFSIWPKVGDNMEEIDEKSSSEEITKNKDPLNQKASENEKASESEKTTKNDNEINKSNN